MHFSGIFFLEMPVCRIIARPHLGSFCHCRGERVTKQIKRRPAQRRGRPAGRSGKSISRSFHDFFRLSTFGSPPIACGSQRVVKKPVIKREFWGQLREGPFCYPAHPGKLFKTHRIVALHGECHGRPPRRRMPLALAGIQPGSLGWDSRCGAQITELRPPIESALQRGQPAALNTSCAR
jgi:hypothetical protein